MRSLMELAYSRESAHVTVLYLGQGRLAVELDEGGSRLAPRVDCYERTATYTDSP